MLELRAPAGVLDDAVNGRSGWPPGWEACRAEASTATPSTRGMSKKSNSGWVARAGGAGNAARHQAHASQRSAVFLPVTNARIAGKSRGLRP